MKTLRNLLLALLALATLPTSANLPLLAGSPRHVAQAPPGGGGDIDDTVLGVACLGLSSNGSVSFPSGTLHDLDNPPDTGDGTDAEQRLEWQGRFFYDSAHHDLHLLGKSAANQGGATDWRHRIYDIDSDTWRVEDFDDELFGGDSTFLNAAGHIYASFDIDPATGDIYGAPGSANNQLVRYNHATDDWEELESDFRDGGNSNPPNGLAWHPNLFGSGDGGTIISTASNGAEFSLYYWRKSTGVPSEQDLNLALGGTSSHGTYFAAIDGVIIGRETNVIVTPGNPPNWTNVGNPPVRTMGTRSADLHGTLLQHPSNAAKMMLFEMAGDKDYFTSTDGDSWTDEGTHPHTESVSNPATLTTLAPDLPCTLSVGYNSGTLNSILFRPAP